MLQLWGINPDTGAVGGPYGNHYAVVVESKDETSGQTTSKILDPQFMQEPMSMNKYFSQIAPLRGVVPHDSHPDSNGLLKNHFEKSPEDYLLPCVSHELDRRWSHKTNIDLARQREDEMLRLGLINEFGASVEMSADEHERLSAQLTPTLRAFDSRLQAWNEAELQESRSAINLWNEMVLKANWYKHDLQIWAESNKNTSERLKQMMLASWEGRLVHLKQQHAQFLSYDGPPPPTFGVGSWGSQIISPEELKAQHLKSIEEQKFWIHQLEKEIEQIKNL